MYNNQKKKYRSSFYSSLIFFFVFDIGILLRWIVPKGKYKVLCWTIMIVLVYSQRVAARVIGIRNEWAILIAASFLTTFGVVMHVMGY